MAKSRETIRKRLRSRTIKIVSTPKRRSRVKKPAVIEMLNMNDDCLFTVFEFMDIKSLCQLANVCQRFKAIAEQIFVRYNKDFNHTNKEFIPEGKSRSNPLFRRILCKFGHLIKKIDDKNFCDDGKIDINAIAKCCSHSLCELKLHDITINCDAVKSLFINLERITLIDCDFVGDDEDIFAMCNKLKGIRLKSDVPPDIIIRKIKQLEKLALSCNMYESFKFYYMISLNPQLRAIQFNAFASDENISAVVQHTKNLRTLVLQPTYRSSSKKLTSKGLLQLGELNKIVDLVIFAHQFADPDTVVTLLQRLLQQNIKFRTLTLCGFPISSRDVKQIYDFKTTKSLHLGPVKCNSEDEIKAIVTELPLLQQLTLYFDRNSQFIPNSKTVLHLLQFGKNLYKIFLCGIEEFVVNQEIYEEFVEVACGTKRRRCVEIDIISDVNEDENAVKFDVPEQLLQTHQTKIKFHFITDTSDDHIYTRRYDIKI